MILRWAAPLVVWLALVAVSSLAGAQSRVPPDFPIAKQETSPGTVTFSHATHAAKVEKCSTCHMRDFKMKRGASGPITLEAKQQGKFCGSCHDGKTLVSGKPVFPIDECDRCHR